LRDDHALPGLEVMRRLREEHHYRGGKSAVYELVRSLRPTTRAPLVRFEGVLGEFSQHDFGQVAGDPDRHAPRGPPDLHAPPRPRHRRSGLSQLRSGPANVLFHVINDRYLNRRPMIFTTNKPLPAWGRVLHDADPAEAILERGRHLDLRGPSYRTKQLKLDVSKPPAPRSSAPATNFRK
jgi:IstB-like ATP binding protein